MDMNISKTRCIYYYDVFRVEVRSKGMPIKKPLQYEIEKKLLKDILRNNVFRVVRP